MTQYMTTLGAYTDHFLQVLGSVKPSPLPLTSKVQTTRYPPQSVCEQQIGSINTKKQQKSIEGSRKNTKHKQVVPFFRQSSKKYIETQQNHMSCPCFGPFVPVPLPIPVQNAILRNPASSYTFRRICYLLLTYVNLLDSRNNKQ